MAPLEVWEKVLVSADFEDSIHGALGCISCHGGVEGILEKEDAHLGMVVDPSVGGDACRECHGAISDTTTSNLHVTQQGYFTAFARRGGDATGSGYHGMFEARCASCHASCGQCHISRPASVGGGLTHGHAFRKSPSQTNQCTACHGSRVGDEFRGKNEGIAPDVHYLGGMNCMDCHNAVELHGDGTTPEHRYANRTGPQCVDCHAGADSAEADVMHHALHAGQVACHVCHSQSYKNCYSCHVDIDSQGLRFPSEIDFRIGRNPDITEQHPYEFVLLRHIPIAPDTFQAWDLTMPEYAAAPTWRMATPHNIQRNTTQTESCENCHAGTDLFLTAEYISELIDLGLMVPEELEANESVLVDEPPGGL